MAKNDRNKKWWCFRQNNSGGSFTGPAINIHIQAYNFKQANDIAEDNGLYFNGQDCECCGDRWYPAYGEVVGPKTTKKSSPYTNDNIQDRLFITLAE